MSSEESLHAERTATLIRRHADDEISIATRSIGRGGVYRNVAHAAMSLRFGRGVPFDLIHAFDSPSLLAACAAPSPVVFGPSEAPALVPAWWRGAMVYRKGTAIANCNGMHRSLVRGGVPGARCEVIGPPVDLQALRAPRDESLRASLGFSSRDRVVIAPGESTPTAGHLLALHAVSILHVLEPRCRMLIWGRGPLVGRLGRLARSLRQPELLIQAEADLGRKLEFERLIRVADLALIASPRPPVMPIAMCMAAGMPIISGISPSIEEFLQDGVTASLALKFAPRLIAHRLLQAIENRDLAMQWGKAGIEAARRFEPAQIARRFVSLYRHAAGVSPKRSAEEQQYEALLSR